MIGKNQTGHAIQIASTVEKKVSFNHNKQILANDIKRKT